MYVYIIYIYIYIYTHIYISLYLQLKNISYTEHKIILHYSILHVNKRMKNRPLYKVILYKAYKAVTYLI